MTERENLPSGKESEKRDIHQGRGKKERSFH
jgi:hypothetical protein